MLGKEAAKMMEPSAVEQVQEREDCAPMFGIVVPDQSSSSESDDDEEEELADPSMAMLRSAGAEVINQNIDDVIVEALQALGGVAPHTEPESTESEFDGQVDAPVLDLETVAIGRAALCKGASEKGSEGARERARGRGSERGCRDAHDVTCLP
eukprot:SAG11_NODE_4791_length_1765_cov_2.259304_4_plen_153_part_00